MQSRLRRRRTLGPAPAPRTLPRSAITGPDPDHRRHLAARPRTLLRLSLWGSRSQALSLTNGDRRRPAPGHDRQHVAAPVVSDLSTGLWADPTAGTHVVRQGRRTPPTAPRSLHTPPYQSETTPYLGGPGRSGGPCPAAAPMLRGIAWLPRTPSCAGTVISCAEAGPIRTGLDAHRSTTSSPRWWLGWRGRIRAGATVGSRASCSSSAIASAPRRSAGSSSATRSHPRLRDKPIPAGGSSYAPRPPACSRSTPFHVDCAATLQRLYDPVRARDRRPRRACPRRNRVRRRPSVIDAPESASRHPSGGSRRWSRAAIAMTAAYTVACRKGDYMADDARVWYAGCAGSLASSAPVPLSAT